MDIIIVIAVMLFIVSFGWFWYEVKNAPLMPDDYDSYPRYDEYEDDEWQHEKMLRTRDIDKGKLDD